MKVARFNGPCFLFALLGLASCEANAQEKMLPKFGDGPNQSVNKHLKLLLKLRIADGRLELDRKSWKDEEMKKRYFEKQLKRIPARTDKQHRFAEQMVARLKKTTSPAAPVFDEIAESALGQKGAGERRSGSSGGSGSGDGVTAHFRGNKFAGLMQIYEGNFKVEFEEKRRPRAVSVTDSGYGELMIIIDSPDLLLVLKQSDSAVRISHMSSDGDQIFREKSFAELQKKHPQYINGVLFPILSYYGFELPLSADDSSVRAAVMARLRSRSNRNATKVDEAMQMLESNKFAEREKATKSIREDYEAYAAEIDRRLKSDSVSAEIKLRLQAIKNSMDDSTKERKQLIDAENLAASPSYLVGMLSDASESDREFIIEQLRKITKKKFETVDQWNQWLDEEKGNSSDN